MHHRNSFLFQHIQIISEKFNTKPNKKKNKNSRFWANYFLIQIFEFLNFRSASQHQRKEMSLNGYPNFQGYTIVSKKFDTL